MEATDMPYASECWSNKNNILQCLLMNISLLPTAIIVHKYVPLVSHPLQPEMQGGITAPVICCPVVKLCESSFFSPRLWGRWSYSYCLWSSSPDQRSCSLQRGRGERGCCCSWLCLCMAGFHFGRQERLQPESRGPISGFWEIRYERLCNSGWECWVVYMCKSRCSVKGAVPALQLCTPACTCMVWCAHGPGRVTVPGSSEQGTGTQGRWGVNIQLCSLLVFPLTPTSGMSKAENASLLASDGSKVKTDSER